MSYNQDNITEPIVFCDYSAHVAAENFAIFYGTDATYTNMITVTRLDFPQSTETFYYATFEKPSPEMLICQLEKAYSGFNELGIYRQAQFELLSYTYYVE